jgi:hypothetical protein
MSEWLSRNEELTGPVSSSQGAGPFLSRLIGQAEKMRNAMKMKATKMKAMKMKSTYRSKRTLGNLLIGALVVSPVVLPKFVSASPLLNLTLTATDTTTNTSSDVLGNLAVNPGDTIDYTLSTVINGGATNANANYTAQSNANQVVGTDGIGALNLQFTDTASELKSVGSLQTGFGAGTGASAGTANGNISGIVALQNTGIPPVGAQTPATVYTGSFTAGTYSSDTLTAALTTSFNAHILLSTGAQHNFNSVSQGADPYVSTPSLTLTEGSSPVPEPASAAIFAIAAGMLLSRRRRA